MRHLILIPLLAAALPGCSILSKDAPATLAAAPTAPQRTPAAVAAMQSRFGTAALKPGQYLWSKYAAEKRETEVLVSLSLQRVFVFQGDTLVGVSSMSSGKPGKETPVGKFPVLQKARDHKSNKYDDAPMPFMQRLDWYGIALHGGAVTGAPASHGCVRLPTAFAKRLYDLTSIGSDVVIEA